MTKSQNKAKKVVVVENVVPARRRRASARKVAKRAKLLTGVNPFGAFGGVAGQFLGGSAGGAVGQAAGNLISRITGYGAYKVQRNTIANGNSVPSFRNGGDGIEVCHREFLFDVQGSVGFANTSLPLNPGLVGTFPWLSLIAANFEEYDMLGLVLEYRPSSGMAVSTTSSALGVVVMATNYDVIDPPFTAKQAMESYEFAVSTVPFTACIHPVECKRNANILNNLFVRSANTPAGADQRLYDMGLFQIATQGMQSVYTVGELWISYHVRFKFPRISASVSNLGYTRIRESPNQTATVATSLGTFGALVTTDSNLGITAYGTAGFVMPRIGTYFVYMTHISSVAGAPTMSWSAGLNMIGGPLRLRDNTVNGITIVNGTNAVNNLTIFQVITAGTGVNNVLTLNLGSATPAIPGTTDIIITYVNDLPVSLTAEEEVKDERRELSELSRRFQDFLVTHRPSLEGRPWSEAREAFERKDSFELLSSEKPPESLCTQILLSPPS